MGFHGEVVAIGVCVWRSMHRLRRALRCCCCYARKKPKENLRRWMHRKDEDGTRTYMQIYKRDANASPKGCQRDAIET